jgi:hypothetical protein
MATVSHYDHATGQSVTRQMTAEEQAIYDAQLAEAQAKHGKPYSTNLG